MKGAGSWLEHVLSKREENTAAQHKAAEKERMALEKAQPKKKGGKGKKK
jgi:hypothetical protein